MLVELLVPLPEGPQKAVSDVCKALRMVLSRFFPEEAEKRVYGPSWRYLRGYDNECAVFRVTDALYLTDEEIWAAPVDKELIWGGEDA